MTKQAIFFMLLMMSGSVFAGSDFIKYIAFGDPYLDIEPSQKSVVRQIVAVPKLTHCSNNVKDNGVSEQIAPVVTQPILADAKDTIGWEPRKRRNVTDIITEIMNQKLESQ